MNSNEVKCTGARPKVRIYQPSGERLITTDQVDVASAISTSLLKYAEEMSQQQVKSAIKIASKHTVLSEE